MKTLATFSQHPALNQNIATKICERIADGESLRTICADATMPARSTVQQWLANSEEFQKAMNLARDMQADALAESVLEIPDLEPDPYRAKLKMDALRWFVSKIRPKKYGNRVEDDPENDGERTVTVIIGGNILPGSDQ